MMHALIIDNDAERSRIIEERLGAEGFSSFERSWTEDQAVEAAARRRPDLVVVGPALDRGCPISAARRISEDNDIPTLLAAAPGSRPNTRLPKEARLSGPFSLSETKGAVKAAMYPAPCAAHYGTLRIAMSYRPS